MITVRIGGAERPLSEATESWVNEQVGRRRNDGVAVCVQIRIDVGTVTMVLSTPACAGTGGGGRPPNDTERRILISGLACTSTSQRSRAGTSSLS